MKPVAKSRFNCHNLRGLRLLSQICHGLSNLQGNKFKHSFHDTLNPIQPYGIDEIEICCHYVLHCYNYSIKSSPGHHKNDLIFYYTKTTWL